MHIFVAVNFENLLLTNYLLKFLKKLKPINLIAVPHVFHEHICLVVESLRPTSESTSSMLIPHSEPS